MSLILKNKDTYEFKYFPYIIDICQRRFLHLIV